MYTHPLLLRQLNICADQLRRAGETAWARRVVQAGDLMRRVGWTEAGKSSIDALFAPGDGLPSLEAVSFGAEHERRLGGPDGVSKANARLSELRIKIRDLCAQPLRQPLPPEAPRPRSPDLP